jgi:hypothetical protein
MPSTIATGSRIAVASNYTAKAAWAAASSYYVVVQDTTANTLVVYKSTDGVTWTAQDTGDSIAAVASSGFGTYLHSNGYLYVAHFPSSTTIGVRRFDTATDQWEASNVGGSFTPSTAPTTTRPLNVGVRSDGDVIVYYTTADGVPYQRYEGSSWSAAAEVDTASGNIGVGLIVTPPDDMVYFFTSQDGGNDQAYRTLTNANVFGTSTDLDQTVESLPLLHMGGEVAHDGSVWHFGTALQDGNDEIDFWHGTSVASSGTTTYTAVENVITTAAGPSSIDTVVYNSKWYVVGDKPSVGIVYNFSDDLATPAFSSQTTLVATAGTFAAQFIKNSSYIGVVYQDSTSVKVEWIVAPPAGPQSHALAGTIAGVATVPAADLVIPAGTHTPTIGNWRFYDDAVDGSMTALAAQNTAPTLTGAQMQNGTIRLRVQIAETGAGAGSGAITARYPSGTGNYNVLTNYDSTSTNVQNHWVRWTNGAGTAGGTITSTKLSGTTASGKYHEATGVSESIASSAIQEIDLAINVRWPPPDETITLELLYDGVLLTGGTPITFETSSAADRPYTIDKHFPGADHKTSSHIGRAPWPAVFHDGTRWWFFIVDETDLNILRSYTWEGSGAWTRRTDLDMTNTGDAGNWNMAFKDVSGTPTFYLNWGRNSSNRYMRKGTVSGTTITWGSTTTLSQANNPYSHISVDDGGYLWLAGLNTGATIWFRRSTNVNDISAWQSVVTHTDTGVASNDIVAVRGLASNRALIVWYREADTSLRYAVVNSTSVVSSGTLDTNVSAEDWGMTRSNGYVYVVHTTTNADGGDWQIEAFNESLETWATGPTYDRPFMDTYSTDDGLPAVAVGDTVYVVGTDAGDWSSDRPLRITPYVGPGAGGTWGTSQIFTPTGRGNGDRIVGPLSAADNKLVYAYDFADDDMEGNTGVTEYHVFTLPSSSHPLTGTVAGTATATAEKIVLTHPLAATEEGTSTAVATTLQTSHAMTATVAGTSTATSEKIVLTHPLSGASAGTGAAVVDRLAIAQPLSATVAGTSTATSDLGRRADIVTESVSSKINIDGAISKPTGTIEGETLLALVTVGGPTAPSLAGWTTIVHRTPDDLWGAAMMYRVAGDSEPSTYTFDAGAHEVSSVAMLRLSGVDATTVQDAVATYADWSDTAPGLTTVTDGATIVVGTMSSGGTITPDPSMVEKVEAGPGTSWGFYANLATETIDTAGATGDRTQTVAFSGQVVTFMVALRPGVTTGAADHVLTGTVAGSATVTVDRLSISQPLTGDVDGTATATVDQLRLAQPLAATVAGTSSVSGAFEVVIGEHPLEGVIAGTSTATATTLFFSHPLAATVPGVSTSDADSLTVGHVLTASLSGDATAVATTLLTSHPLSGATSGVATTEAQLEALAGEHPLSGDAVGASTASVDQIRLTHALFGESNGASIGTASGLTLSHSLQGTTAGTSTSTAVQLQLTHALIATVSGVGAINADLPARAYPLSGQLSGVSLVEATTLLLSHVLSSQSNGSAQATATALSLSHVLTGLIAGTSTMTATQLATWLSGAMTAELFLEQLLEAELYLQNVLSSDVELETVLSASMELLE